MPAETINESALQAALVERLSEPDLGWRFVEGVHLLRALDDVMVAQSRSALAGERRACGGERGDGRLAVWAAHYAVRRHG